MDMPKMNERERLADLEARQRKVAEEVEQARRALRARYGAVVAEFRIEAMTERELRDLLTQAIRVGGAASIAALKAAPSARPDPRPSLEGPPGGAHGRADRARSQQLAKPVPG